MTNVICSLKYESGIEKLETEEQLFSVFSELEKNYNEFRKQFEILDSERNPINDFSGFLAQAVEKEKGMVFLRGSGEIAGLVVKDAILEYDLGDVIRLTRYWDIYRARDCFACNNRVSYRIDEDTTKSECKKSHKPINAQKCGDDFDAHIKNSQGKAARTLQEMVEVTVKV